MKLTMDPNLLALLLSYLLCVHIINSNNNGCKAISRNLALKKPTWQSTVYQGTSGQSRHAVDGDRNPKYEEGSCMHTRWGSLTWWLVDLQSNYAISSIQITNRDKMWERLSNFSVEVSLDSPSLLPGFPGKTTAAVCLTEHGHLGNAEVKLYRCREPLWGRYIRLVKYAETWDLRPLHFCEFEVFDSATWRFTSSSRSTVSPVVIRSVPGVVSNVACATLCSQNSVGRRCESIQRHILSGECQLLGSPPGSDQLGDQDWVTYEVVTEV